jgi:hypothetical protein
VIAARVGSAGFVDDADSAFIVVARGAVRAESPSVSRVACADRGSPAVFTSAVIIACGRPARRIELTRPTQVDVVMEMIPGGTCRARLTGPARVATANDHAGGVCARAMVVARIRRTSFVDKAQPALDMVARTALHAVTGGGISGVAGAYDDSGSVYACTVSCTTGSDTRLIENT